MEVVWEKSMEQATGRMARRRTRDDWIGMCPRIDVVHTSYSLGIERQSFIVLVPIKQTPPIVESGTRLVTTEGSSAS
jgi:hypothetical protein